MDGSNRSNVIEFILLGFSEKPGEQVIFFLVFLMTYLTTVAGNLAIILLVKTACQLQTPMYFFLMILSFVDMSFSSVTVPKMLTNIFSSKKTISIAGCFTQMYFLIFYAATECMLLGVMAYDRYVAICYPLRYSQLMNRKLCLQMVVTSCISASLHSLLHVLLITMLSFCGPNRIHHFFCDMIPLLQLSCSDTSVNEMVVYTEAPLVIMAPFLVTVVSYVRIASAIWKIPSATGRRRTFSTCSSHLTVVIMFYGAIISTYFRPSSNLSPDSDKVKTAMYSVVVPMLNPFIYSLRNNDVKEAFKKAIFRGKFTKKT
ncbi:hypothetical protein NDU88_003363 [Pleurodeles waltl]|uniref:Olfactory receptor n=1 Tax=Pleurodeles waltl TaxID=8319 RepID=A0AAV7Q9U2_PLEWA|nr:hypothetical protein NDU88_003363 [Pleurodeles waltl]